MNYSEEVARRVEDPGRVGELDAADGEVGVGTTGEDHCGDVLKMYLRIRDGRVAEARFKVFGCSGAIAACSLAAERVEGRPVREVDELEGEALNAALELPADKAHAGRLAAEAVRAAVADWRSRQRADG